MTDTDEVNTETVPHVSSTPFKRPVIIVLILALFSSTAISSVEWTSLSYLRSIHLATQADVSFYLTISAIANFTPVLFNPILGRLSAARGSLISLRLTLTIVAVGLFILLFNRSSRLLFIIGWTCYASNNAVRLLRIGFLAELVEPRHRTTMLAVHQLMAPAGFALGPILWIVFQSFTTPFVLFGKLFIDSFFFVHGTMLLAASAAVYACFFEMHQPLDAPVISAGNSLNRTADRLRNSFRVPERSSSPSLAEPSSSQHRLALVSRPTILPSSTTIIEATIQETDQAINVINVYVIGTMLVAARFTSSMIVVAYQPLMVNLFQVDDKYLAKTYIFLSIFNFLPPVATAILSTWTQDRRIMQLGAIVKTLAGLLILPIFGPVREWQVVAGLGLGYFGGSLFTPAAVSMFTKCYSSRAFSRLLGVAWSLSSGIPAVVQLLFKEEVASSLGRWNFIIFVLPAIAVIVAMCFPAVWKMLEDRHYRRQII